MTMFGYARVSTRDQDLTSQEHELRGAGCAKVYKEKVSGAKTDRAELLKVIRRLECHSACNFDPLSRGIGVQN
jgi:DNA invertase Pin-like site-specific DNA recombinase